MPSTPIVLEGRSYAAEDFIGDDGYGYQELMSTGQPRFPNQIFADMIATLAPVSTALADVAAAIAASLKYKGAYGSGTAYTTNDVVVSGVTLYRALNSSTGSAPPSSHWEVLLTVQDVIDAINVTMTSVTGTATADHLQALADSLQAGNNNTRAGNDHTTAGNDHTQAGLDTVRAGNDHTQAGLDSVQASNDHTQAGLDAVRAGNDHTTAGNDSTQAGLDTVRAGNDHTQAGLDSVQAGNNNTRASNDHTTATDDHTNTLAAIAASPRFRGDYSGATAYVLNDLVRESTGSERYWRALGNTIGNAPAENTHWTIWLDAQTAIDAVNASLANSKNGQLTFVFDGRNGVPTTGGHCYAQVPYNGTITKYRVLEMNGVVASAVVDILRSAVSIVGAGNKPTLAAAADSGRTNVASWTHVDVAQGDILDCVPSSFTTGTVYLVILEITKT